MVFEREFHMLSKRTLIFVAAVAVVAVAANTSGIMYMCRGCNG
jgi:hypothetical protein